MPVIIEEVVGSVIAEAPGSAEKSESVRAMHQGRALPDPRGMRSELQRMARRQARLRAD
jgi:hypothetical protein